MTIREIIGLYEKNSPQANELIQNLGGITNARIQVRGLAGSAGAFIAASALKQTFQSHLFILPDQESAAYFLNDLEGLLENNNEGEEVKNILPLFFFPASYRKPYHVEETDNANVLLRAEVLDRIRREKRVAVVTYPGALSEKVVTRQLLEKIRFN